MTMMNIHKSKSMKGILFSLMFVFAATFSFDVWAANACAVRYKGGQVTPECPDGKKPRYDISPKCIEEANRKEGSCINTMPVTNVARVPEDVCFRGKGWGRKRNHNGMDYAAARGTPVKAAMDGKIIRFTFGTPEPARGVCQSSGGGYGNVIYIEHQGCDGKYVTRYGHLTNRTVRGLGNGIKVKKGQLIGYVGGTGGACGRPHLHFELRGPGDVLMNPLCDQIQSVCNCKTPIPSSGLSKCKEAPFEASSSSEIDYSESSTDVTVAYSEEAYGANSKFDVTCKPYEEVRNGYREWGCIFCKPFDILYTVASEIAQKSFDIFAKAVIPVVLVAMALWVIFLTLRFVSTMDIKEPRIYVKTLLNQLFRVLFIVILLNTNLPYIMSSTIDPIFTTGLEIAQLAGKVSNTCDLGEQYHSPTEGQKIVSNGALSQEMKIGILCTIKSVQDQISDILAFGELSWCLAWTKEHRIFYIFPHTGYIINALLFYIGGFLLIVIYPFKLVDCILKLAIMVALLPLALGAFAFKITSNYLKKLWETFLNAMFSFIFLSVIIYIIVSVAAEVVNDIFSRDTSFITVMLWWSVDTLKVFIVCMLGWAVMDEMKKFSDSFSKSAVDFKNSPGGIGSSTGSMATEMFVKRPAVLTAKGGYYVGKRVAPVIKSYHKSHSHRNSIDRWNNAADDTPNTLFGMHIPLSPFTKRYSRLKPVVQNVVNTAGKLVPTVLRDAKGNIIYNTTSLRQKLLGISETRSFDKSNPDNIMMTTTRQYRSGKRIVKTTDRYATHIEIYNKNGVKIVDNYKVHDFNLNYISRSNGQIDCQKIQEFMTESSFDEANKRDIVLKTILQKRMPAFTEAQLNQFDTARLSSRTIDHKGREVWSLSQDNPNGSVTLMNITFGANNRVMSELKVIDGANERSYMSDGIMQKITTVKKDALGNIISDNKEYAFSRHYSRATFPLHRDGTFIPDFPSDEIMFEQTDIDDFANQLHHRTFYEFS